jgi:tRNA1(Val) A37 N6-methylase TrmN6
MDSVSENALLGKRIRLLQPRRGYRAGLDAVLLAAACDAGAGARVLEAGCGVGAVLLCAATLRPGAAFTGVERDPQAVALARRNAELNGLQDRVEVLEGDTGRAFRDLGLAPFDAALANPPFFDDEATLRAPAPEKRPAWIAEAGLEAWSRFLIKAVREGGTITLIHRAERLADLLDALSPKAGSVQVRPVHPFADAPAKRVLVRAVKTGKAPLRLLPPLVLHAPGGGWTAEAERILRGEASLAWERS